MSEEDNLGNVLFEWATNSEFQAIFLVGCTCVGIWVLIKWIMQVLYACLLGFVALLFGCCDIDCNARLEENSSERCFAETHRDD
ncbi:hypothetical protein QE152_g4214 [Popillia japonica]|uniref:Uncharacterized protein n=1 Tax=Popillia japonica TaxID=7064 RepID=A0AAW1N3C4_POPJA